MTETETCDRCGATIVLEFPDEVRPLNLAFEVSDDDSDGPVYEQRTRILCDACEQDLLDWIDEGGIDRSDCVDLPRMVDAAETITRTANTLDQLANVLETELDPS